MKHVFTSDETFKLESKQFLPNLEITYHTYGKLNKNKSNVIWVCHALTANSDVFDWWNGLFGQNKLFNPDEYFIICANILGSCYGTTGPISKHKFDQEKYYHDFPTITIRDIVNAHKILKKHLGINEIFLLIGGSLGGQQALEWSVEESDNIKNLVLIATNAKHSPWGIAFNESQRLAIKSDQTFYNKSDDAGKNGLIAARSIALLSYRNYHTYYNSQNENSDDVRHSFKASSYQQYQGVKLVQRFNAFSYITLANAMDSHNVGRNRKGVENALEKIKSNTLIIAIESDILFPPVEQRLLYKHIPNAVYSEIKSEYGHDGFLIETEKISRIIQKEILWQHKLISDYSILTV